MITAKGLTKKLGRTKALESVDLTIGSGETVAIFGPNGAGKSTLLKLAAGLLRPTAGSVRVGGKDPRALKGSIGYLGHQPYLYGYLSAQENLEFFSDLYGVERSGAVALLEKVGMLGKRGLRINELSQGETQRVALARALLHDPDYLLLDEPFANLDAEAAALVHPLLERDGRTVLLVTHDLARGRRLAGRTVCLDGGRVSKEDAA